MSAQVQIMLFLAWHVGKENAETADRMLDYLHALPVFKETVPSVRELQHVVRDMRREGYIIGSCSSGYFKPRDAAEAREYLETEFHSRALDLLVTLRAQRRAIINEYGRQTRMFT